MKLEKKEEKKVIDAFNLDIYNYYNCIFNCTLIKYVNRFIKKKCAVKEEQFSNIQIHIKCEQIEEEKKTSVIYIILLYDKYLNCM